MKSKSPIPPQALYYSRPRSLPAVQPGVPQLSPGRTSPASFIPPAFDLRRGAGEVWLETPAEAARAESLQAHASAEALARLKAENLTRSASGATLKSAERRVERSSAGMRALASEPRLRPVGEHGFSQAPRKSVAARFPLQRTLTDELVALQTPSLPSSTPLPIRHTSPDSYEAPRTKPQPGATASPSAARAAAELRATAAATEPESGSPQALGERALALAMLSSIPWLVDSPTAKLQVGLKVPCAPK